jgi:large subunit ribosomal protein L30
MAEGKIRIKLVASPIGAPQKLKLVVKGLGLHRINQVVEKPDTPGFRGMVAKVPHLVKLVD